MKDIYFRFIALAQALEGASSQVSSVDETSKQLLKVIASKHSQNETMTVTDAMALTDIASPATIHRKLDDLREAGLIDQVFAENNRRTKYLIPTQDADKHFANLGSVMKQILASP